TGPLRLAWRPAALHAPGGRKRRAVLLVRGTRHRITDHRGRRGGGVSKSRRSTTMIYTHVLNRGPAAVRSPADRMFLSCPRVLHRSATQDSNGAVASGIAVLPRDY